MAENKKAVFGIFAVRGDCELAANELIARAFSPADFSVLPPEPIASSGKRDDAAGSDEIAAASPGASLAATIACLGIPPPEVSRCEARLQNGGVLFCVYCSSADQIESAKEILRRNGAEEIAKSSESRIARNESETDSRTAGSR